MEQHKYSASQIQNGVAASQKASLGSAMLGGALAARKSFSPLNSK
jgi:hypothetical protein